MIVKRALEGLGDAGHQDLPRSAKMLVMGLAPPILPLLELGGLRAQSFTMALASSCDYRKLAPILLANDICKMFIHFSVLCCGGTGQRVWEKSTT